jgi:L-aminopeptidase/D-esterase-like protein
MGYQAQVVGGRWAKRAGISAQSNYGIRRTLRIAGVPVGEEIADLLRGSALAEERGSIIVVLATDAPLLPHQLRRLAQRARLGLRRMGRHQRLHGSRITARSPRPGLGRGR